MILINKRTEVQVMVFQTSLEDENDIRRAEFVLNNHHHIYRWTVDLEDWEKVLKVEADRNVSYQEIERKISLLGYQCKELDH